jgi:branched-chain amino acid aminotransferase
MNGELLPDDDARVSVFDHGLVVGDGVFETIKVASGVPFAMTRHLVRLRRSALGLGLPEPDIEAIREGALAVIAASGGPVLARLRVTVTGGVSPLGGERGNAPVTAIGYMEEKQLPAAS